MKTMNQINIHSLLYTTRVWKFNNISKTYIIKNIRQRFIGFKPRRVSCFTRTKRCWENLFFYMIMGLIGHDTGSILLDKNDISEFPMYRRAKLGLGYLPQESSVFRGLNVEENILAVLEKSSKNNDEKKKVSKNYYLILALSMSEIRPLYLFLAEKEED